MSQQHKIISPGQGAMVHPSCRFDGESSFECECCGKEVRYARKEGEYYVLPDGEKVGYDDIGTNEDLCLECESERFSEE